MKGVNGMSSPTRDEAEILYVIESKEYGVGEKQYLTITGFEPDRLYNSIECARISWVRDLAGASEWFFDAVGNKQVFLKRFTEEGWILDSGWCVGIETAEYLAQKFGGVIVPEFRHNSR
jgi:hypothetical protein